MTIRDFKIAIRLLVFLLFLSGCSILPGSRSQREEIVDPLVERNRRWQEQVDRGNWALQNGDLDRALEGYQAALSIKPDSSEVQQKIAEIHFQKQEHEKARDAFAVVVELDPKNIGAWNYLGYINENLSNYEAAAKAYEGTLRVDPRNLYALNHLGLAYKQLNRLDEAERMLRKAMEIDPKSERPESKNLHNYLGLVYLERGEIGEAIAEFRESIRRHSNDIWARQNLAALYENHGRYYEAQLQYSEILQIDPNNLLAPSRLQALAQLGGAVAAPVDIPPVDLIDTDVEAIIAAAPDAAAYPDADAIILLNQFSHDVSPTGKSRYTSHQVVKILTDRGVQKYDDIAIPYTPSGQHIAVNVARTILPDGAVVEPPDEAYNDVTPPGLLSYNLYSDGMWRVISMPALAPGVCIEYQVTLEDAGVEAVGGASWFWGGYSFQSTDPTLQSNYALRVPKDTKFRWKAINCGLAPQVLHDETGSVYLWTYGETPALKEEYNMPPMNDLIPRLTYSSVESWDAIYNWYKDLAKDRYTADERIEETVRQLTANLTTREDKIREIYHYVASQIRYVGIELGQGAYQPTPADEVFKLRYGDCKDKGALLISMLDLAGVEAFPVLINPDPYERVDVELPSLAQFSHLIVAVPREDSPGQQFPASGQYDVIANGRQTGEHYIWLDPTSETCSFGDLPARNQGRKGFVIGRDRGEFVDIPVYPPESNQLLIHTEISLDTGGAVSGTMRIQTSGQYSTESRSQYREVAPSALKDVFAAELNKQFPGVQITDLSILGLNDLSTPLEIEIAFYAQDYARRLNGYTLFPMPSDEFSDYAEIFAATERQFPLELGYPMMMNKTVEITLPEGWIASLPGDRRMEHGFASMYRSCRQEGERIRYQLNFSIKKPVIALEDYPAAKRFFDALTGEDKTQLILRNLKA